MFADVLLFVDKLVWTPLLVIWHDIQRKSLKGVSSVFSRTYFMINVSFKTVSKSMELSIWKMIFIKKRIVIIWAAIQHFQDHSASVQNKKKLAWRPPSRLKYFLSALKYQSQWSCHFPNESLTFQLNFQSGE